MMVEKTLKIAYKYKYILMYNLATSSAFHMTKVYSVGGSHRVLSFLPSTILIQK
jgi:uncharacterized SAM-dependent methyltransferase